MTSRKIILTFVASGLAALLLVTQGFAANRPPRYVAQGKAGGNGAGPVVTPAPGGEGKSKRVKFKDKTTVDFEDTLIEGQVKNPFASMVSTRDQDFGKGFIKIRYNWHDQLIMSVSGLSQ